MAASTGSPASRKSTKLTPLTTRPSLTSRQGITRTLNILMVSSDFSPRAADQRQRCGGIEPAVIEGTAGDRAGEPRRARREHRLDIFDSRQAAGGDHRNRDLICERNGR